MNLVDLGGLMRDIIFIIEEEFQMSRALLFF